MVRSRTFTASSATAAHLFPFAAGAGAPASGTPVGRHLMWQETVCLDPFTWLSQGLTTNTGMFQLGQPGTGKSAFAKRQIMGMVAAGVRPVVLGDPKGEYCALVQRLGGQVIRLGPGLDRINPLDCSSLGEGSDEQVRAQRLSILSALSAQARRDRRLTNGEELVLAAALDAVSGLHEPTVADVLGVLSTAPEPVLAAAQARSTAQYDDLTRELRWTLGMLLTGSLAGVFDGRSSRHFAPDARAVAIDISAAQDDALLGAAMLTAWSWGHAAVVAQQRQQPGSRWLLVMDELWRALRGAAGLVDHIDALTRLNRSRGIASLMITHSVKDLETLRDPADVAKATGFIDRSAIVVLSGLPRRELDLVGHVVPLTEAEKALVSSWSSGQRWRSNQRHPGRGKYLIKTGHRPGLPVAMTLTESEMVLYNTDPP